MRGSEDPLNCPCLLNWNASCVDVLVSETGPPPPGGQITFAESVNLIRVTDDYYWTRGHGTDRGLITNGTPRTKQNLVARALKWVWEVLDRRYVAAQIFDEPSTHRGPSGQKRYPRGIWELIDICWGYQLMRGGINELGHVLFDDLKGSRGCLWMFDLIWNLKYFYYYFPIFHRSVSIKAYLFHPKVVGV